MTADAPGLQPRKRKDGVAWYWVAVAVTRNTHGFRPATVRLTDPTHELRAARCRRLTAELRRWIAGIRPEPHAFDGTIASLVRGYQVDPDSPYRRIKANTRRDYDYGLQLVERGVGHWPVSRVTASDIWRWFREVKAPAEPGGPERLRRAESFVKALRNAVKYGRGEHHEGCRELSIILSEMRFPSPAPRETFLTYAQAAAIVDRALATGRVSIAIGQALQFECTLRQIDVIGEWGAAKTGDNYSEKYSGGIIHRGRRWSGGLLWSQISPDLVLTKVTTKTGARGEWDLNLCPLVMRALAHVPPERRVGPVVVMEGTDLPYANQRYGQVWRSIADECGVPKTVWNRDSRAGGLTEGDLAGADLGDLQKTATHSTPKTTGIYVRSTTRKATDKVAILRAKARKGE